MEVIIKGQLMCFPDFGDAFNAGRWPDRADGMNSQREGANRERTVRNGTGRREARRWTQFPGSSYIGTCHRDSYEQSRMTNGRRGSGRTALMFPLSPNNLLCGQRSHISRDWTVLYVPFCPLSTPPRTPSEPPWNSS